MLVLERRIHLSAAVVREASGDQGKTVSLSPAPQMSPGMLTARPSSELLGTSENHTPTWLVFQANNQDLGQGKYKGAPFSITLMTPPSVLAWAQ